MSRKERIRMIVVKAGDLAAGTGVLMPADGLSQGRLRAKGYGFGEEVFVEMRRPRSPGYHRFAHALGQLIIENLDEFDGLDAHQVLKRLQIESGAGCDEMGIRVGGQMVIHRIPKSLSYESMDEGEFRELMHRLIGYLVRRYWPDCTADEIVQMAEQAERRAA